MSVGRSVGRLVGRSICPWTKFLLFSIAPGLIKGEDEDGARRRRAPSLLKSPQSHGGGGRDEVGAPSLIEDAPGGQGGSQEQEGPQSPPEEEDEAGRVSHLISQMQDNSRVVSGVVRGMVRQVVSHMSDLNEGQCQTDKDVIVLGHMAIILFPVLSKCGEVLKRTKTTKINCKDDETGAELCQNQNSLGTSP